MMLMMSATKVELKATPRALVTPEMSPCNASSARCNATPIPRTVPINPMEGIAQTK